MIFSAYQIESMLEDFQKNILPIEKSSRDILSISENAINESLNESIQNHINQKDIPLSNINPNNISHIVEDKNLYDPIIDYVQQSRAGLFVVPNYTPDNPPPKFPLVKEFSGIKLEPEKNDKKDDLRIENNLINNLKLVKTVEEKESFDKLDYKECEPKNSKQFLKSSTEEDFDEDFSSDSIDEKNDVVFGEGPIIKSSISKFLREYPESAIKFLLRKNLDGRPLPIEYEEIYQKWEHRGLSKEKLRKYLFKVMQWEEFPDRPVLEILKIIRDHLFEIKKKNNEFK